MSTSSMGLIAWVVCSLIAILFAFVPPGSGWCAFDRIVQTMSAVGTVGAVFAALWLGMHTNEKEKRAALSKSKAIGARLHPQLVIGADLIDRFVELLNDLPPPSRQAAYNPSGYEELIKKTSKSLCDAVNLPVWDTDIQHLSDLVHIDSDVRLSLARAMGIISNVRVTLPEPKDDANTYRCKLSDARKRLTVAARLVQEATEELNVDIQRFLNDPSRTEKPTE